MVSDFGDGYGICRAYKLVCSVYHQSSQLHQHCCYLISEITIIIIVCWPLRWDCGVIVSTIKTNWSSKTNNLCSLDNWIFSSSTLRNSRIFVKGNYPPVLENDIQFLIFESISSGYSRNVFLQVFNQVCPQGAFLWWQNQLCLALQRPSRYPKTP